MKVFNLVSATLIASVVGFGVVHADEHKKDDKKVECSDADHKAGKCKKEEHKKEEHKK